MSKDGGTATLHEELEALTSALRAFEDPVVDQLPGLRLMRESLREREAHIRAQITAAETCSLTLEIKGGPAAGGVLDAGFACHLLLAVQAGVTQAGRSLARHAAGMPDEDAVDAALGLYLAAVTPVGAQGAVTLRLERRPGGLEGLLAAPGGESPLVDAAVESLVAALDDDGPDGPDGPDEVAEAVAPLGNLLAAHALRLTVTASTTPAGTREVAVSRARAQQLSARASG